MKKQFSYLISGGLASIIFFSTSIAQETGFRELPPVTITATSTSTSLNAKLNKVFNEYFQGATHLRWYEIDKKYLVKFILNDQENRALFTRSGNLVYHISYGSEKDLPADVRQLVKSTYYDQTITRIFKVSQDKRLIWVVSLEDKKNYIMVRVEDNELEETQRMEKIK